MAFRKMTDIEIEIDDDLIIEAINSGSGISFGSIAKAALDTWSQADLDSLAGEAEMGEIRAVEKILAAMRGTT